MMKNIMDHLPDRCCKDKKCFKIYWMSHCYILWQKSIICTSSSGLAIPKLSKYIPWNKSIRANSRACGGNQALTLSYMWAYTLIRKLSVVGDWASQCMWAYQPFQTFSQNGPLFLGGGVGNCPKYQTSLPHSIS